MGRTTRRAWVCVALFTACASSPPPSRIAAPPVEKPVTFADDLAFLKQHTQLVLLHDSTQRAALLVAPEYQGRVLTSTNAGKNGRSFGFVHRDNVAAHERAPHINVFGGEDRFWLGPEGGQFGLYFPPGAPFDLENWQVPDAIDWGGWRVTDQNESEVKFSRDMQLENYSGTRFVLQVERSIRVLERPALQAALAVPLAKTLDIIGYESDNLIRNTGAAGWSHETGLLSIWILGMFNPGPRTTIVIPFRAGPESELGPVVNDAYFGAVPPQRLHVQPGVVFFRGDGQMRGKIGIPRPRALPQAGAWDAAAGVLTIVQFSLPENAHDYVNSMWEEQAAPYSGDVVNSYNDGPPEPGAPPLGPFFELETSSPAAALAPGETLSHVVRTFHASGPRPELDKLAQRWLGVTLERIEQTFER